MKKLLFSAVIALLAMSNVNAQEVKFGAKAGVNFASVSGDDVDNFDGRTSLNFGAVVNIGLSEKLAIQPELVYSSQGFKGSDLGIDYTGKLDYINLPILADIMLGDGFSLQAGPQIGFNVTDKLEAEGQSESIDAESIDFSAALGAQYILETGLFFQARYTLGLTDVVKDADAINNVFSISVGFFF